jgi:hypothetical protein
MLFSAVDSFVTAADEKVAVTFFLRKRHQVNPALMLTSYFKVAFRNLARHKYLSMLNALGLALGMSVSLLLISFYSFVSSFDDFHIKGDNIYRIISTVEQGLQRTDLASAPFIVAKNLENDVPGIDEVVCINSAFNGAVVSDKFNMPVSGYYADDNFFSVFDFKLLQGNPRTALQRNRPGGHIKNAVEHNDERYFWYSILVTRQTNSPAPVFTTASSPTSFFISAMAIGESIEM